MSQSHVGIVLFAVGVGLGVGLIITSANAKSEEIFADSKKKNIIKKRRLSNSLSIYQNIYRIVTLSCPGKVLIAGGYLVLQRPNIGVTVAGDSRFYTTCTYFQGLPPVLSKNFTFSPSTLVIVVYSPQFYEEYHYIYDAKQDSLYQVRTILLSSHHLHRNNHLLNVLTLILATYKYLFEFICHKVSSNDIFFCARKYRRRSVPRSNL